MEHIWSNFEDNNLCMLLSIEYLYSNRNICSYTCMPIVCLHGITDTELPWITFSTNTVVVLSALPVKVYELIASRYCLQWWLISNHCCENFQKWYMFLDLFIAFKFNTENSQHSTIFELKRTERNVCRTSLQYLQRYIVWGLFIFISLVYL